MLLFTSIWTYLKWDFKKVFYYFQTTHPWGDFCTPLLSLSAAITLLPEESQFSEINPRLEQIGFLLSLLLLYYS